MQVQVAIQLGQSGYPSENCKKTNIYFIMVGLQIIVFVEDKQEQQYFTGWCSSRNLSQCPNTQKSSNKYIIKLSLKKMPKVELQFQGKINTIQFAPELTTKEHIEGEIKKLWGLSFNEVHLTYADADGDQISVDIQDDFDVARDTMTTGKDQLVFTAKLAVGAVPKFLEVKNDEQVAEVKVEEKQPQKPQEEKKDEKTEENPGVETEESIANRLKQRKMKEKVEANLEKARMKAEMEEKKKAQAAAKQEAKQKAKAEAAEKKKIAAEQAQIAKKKAVEQKQRKMQEAAEKAKEKKRVNASSEEKDNSNPKIQEVAKQKTELNEQRVRALVREEVLKMIPQIKKEMHSIKPSKAKENKNKEEESLCEDCSQRITKNDVPFYFNPATKGYLCQECEAKSTEKSPLLKIRDPNHFENTFYTYAGVVTNEEAYQKEQEDFDKNMEETRQVLMAKIKVDFKVKMQEKKKKMSQKKQ